MRGNEIVLIALLCVVVCQEGDPGMSFERIVAIEIDKLNKAVEELKMVTKVPGPPGKTGLCLCTDYVSRDLYASNIAIINDNIQTLQRNMVNIVDWTDRLKWYGIAGFVIIFVLIFTK